MEAGAVTTPRISFLVVENEDTIVRNSIGSRCFFDNVKVVSGSNHEASPGSLEVMGQLIQLIGGVGPCELLTGADNPQKQHWIHNLETAQRSRMSEVILVDPHG